MSLRDAIRQEVETREAAQQRAARDLELLAQIEELAAQLGGEDGGQPAAEAASTGAAGTGWVRRRGGAGPDPAEPRRASNGIGRDGLGERQSQLLTAIRTEPGLAPRDYAARLGCSSSAITAAQRSLHKRGLIYTEGNRSTARYYPAVDGPPPRALDGGDGTTRKQTEHKASAARAESIGALRVKVLDLVRDNDGVLDEEGLAYGTGRFRDDVAEACGRLLLDGKLVLNPDGTYRLP